MKPDFESIVNLTNRYNFHSHTQFCDGRDTMEAIVKSAVAAGFGHWGFSPHGPMSVSSPCNMALSDMKAYLTEVRRLRKLYPSLSIYAGIEADFIDVDKDNPDETRRRFPELDFIIGSVHFIPTQDGRPVDIDGSPERFAVRLKEDFNGDLDYVIRTFWEQTEKMIATGGFDIIGHIDKIAANASFVRPEIEMEPDYRRLADHAIGSAIDSKVVIEINTKHRLSSRRFFPHPRHWVRLVRNGVTLTINSDAHFADKIDSSRAGATLLLKAITTLDSEGASLVVVNGPMTETFTGRGVSDLYRLVTERPELLGGATVADKIVGRGAAALMIAGGINQVYAEVISRPALDLFSRFPSIMVDYGIIADGIINRTGDGPCPVEALTSSVESVDDCVALIGDFINRSSN